MLCAFGLRSVRMNIGACKYARMRAGTCVFMCFKRGACVPSCVWVCLFPCVPGSVHAGACAHTRFQQQVGWEGCHISFKAPKQLHRRAHARNLA